MNKAISFSPRRLVVVGLLGLVAVATVGFAATNTVSTSNAGDGQAGISGYTVTAVHYTLDATNPNLTTSLSFTVSQAIPGTGTKRVSIDGGTTWIPAGNCSGTTSISCTAAVAVTALTNLRVVAAD
ncbi:MAG: hypothetical protein ABI577_18695 [bacterium]